MYKADSFTARLNRLFDEDPRTDTAIADALGVSKQALSGWRAGTRFPRSETVKAIAQMYGVSTDWLYGYEETIVSVTGSPPTDLTTEELLLISVYRSATPDRRNRAIRVLTGQE